MAIDSIGTNQKKRAKRAHNPKVAGSEPEVVLPEAQGLLRSDVVALAPVADLAAELDVASGV